MNFAFDLITFNPFDTCILARAYYKDLLIFSKLGFLNFDIDNVMNIRRRIVWMLYWLPLKVTLASLSPGGPGPRTWSSFTPSDILLQCPRYVTLGSAALLEL